MFSLRNRKIQVAAVLIALASTMFSSASAQAFTSYIANAPRGVVASNATPGAITMSWKADTGKGIAKVNDYVIQYRVTGTAKWITLKDGVNTKTKFVVKPLAALINYDFRVAAHNNFGNGAYTAVSVKTKDTGISNAPAALTASAADSSKIVLDWTTPFNTHDGVITDYVVSYRVNGAGTWTVFPHPQSTDTVVTVTGLTANTIYDFKVAAKTDSGLGDTVTTSGSTVGAVGATVTTFVTVGDAYSRGFNVNNTFACKSSDCPDLSWSAGTDATVNSHFLRVKAVNNGTAPNASNYATDGAKVADLDAQLKKAPTAAGSYVTISIGANDVCKSATVGAMPTQAAFTTSFRTALTNYIARNSDAKIFVNSIPNLLNIYNAGKGVSGAQAVYDSVSTPVCPLVVNSTVATDATRSSVLTNIIAYNSALQSVCSTFANNCKFDNLAVYNYVFSSSQLSPFDFWNFSATGQQALSELTWSKSWWGQ